MAEWSKALVLGTSHFDGVGSNPTPAIFFSYPTHTHLQITHESLLQLLAHNSMPQNLEKSLETML